MGAITKLLVWNPGHAALLHLFWNNNNNNVPIRMTNYIMAIERWIVVIKWDQDIIIILQSDFNDIPG